jgi:hypothetical protein
MGGEFEDCEDGLGGRLVSSLVLFPCEPVGISLLL